MHTALRLAVLSDDHGDAFLTTQARGADLPFNFDADLGAQGAALDVGFSFDPLPGLSVSVRPALELCAFIGLQRFRPVQVKRENRYQYAAWADPLPAAVASAAASGSLDSIDCRRFEFRLLYRTKYLKSFLASKPVRGES
jgi:CRISPR-associated protein Csb3